MRNFKFRAWESGKMYYQVRCGGVFDGIPTAPTVWNESAGDWLNLTGEPHTKVMQYTGLKDENEKEIYEGDILKCKCRKTPWNEDYFNYEQEHFFKNSVVEWWESFSNIGYRLKDGKGKTLMIKPSSLSKMEVEVIGNIYENPELLKS